MLTLEEESRIEIITHRNHSNHWAKELERDFPLYQIIERKLRRSLKEFQKEQKSKNRTT
jgi:hypothetical protein